MKIVLFVLNNWWLNVRSWECDTHQWGPLMSKSNQARCQPSLGVGMPVTSENSCVERRLQPLKAADISRQVVDGRKNGIRGNGNSKMLCHMLMTP